MTWPSHFHLNPERDRQNTACLHGCRNWRWEDPTLTDCLPSVLPWQAMFSRHLSDLQLRFLGHPHLTQLLATAIYAFSPQPVPLSLHDMHSLAFAELLLTRWMLLSFRISLIYFHPQAYSMCTTVWIVMNFGFSSRMSKACFQLNKPNEVKSFTLLLLDSHYPSQRGAWLKNASSGSWKNF